MGLLWFEDVQNQAVKCLASLLSFTPLLFEYFPVKRDPWNMKHVDCSSGITSLVCVAFFFNFEIQMQMVEKGKFVRFSRTLSIAEKIVSDSPAALFPVFVWTSVDPLPPLWHDSSRPYYEWEITCVAWKYSADRFHSDRVPSPRLYFFLSVFQYSPRPLSPTATEWSRLNESSFFFLPHLYCLTFWNVFFYSFWRFFFLFFFLWKSCRWICFSH